MNWKEFLKPEVRKFLVISILINITLLILLVCNYAIFVMQQSCNSIITSVIRLPVYFLVGGWILTIISTFLSYSSHLFFIVLLDVIFIGVYWYLISSIIIYAYDKYKK